MFSSGFLPCPGCGESLAREAVDAHRCSREREVEFQMFHLRHDLAAFEDRFRAYLRTPEGRFETWQAEQMVHDAAG